MTAPNSAADATGRAAAITETQNALLDALNLTRHDRDNPAAPIAGALIEVLLLATRWVAGPGPADGTEAAAAIAKAVNAGWRGGGGR